MNINDYTGTADTYSSIDNEVDSNPYHLNTKVIKSEIFQPERKRRLSQNYNYCQDDTLQIT